MVDPAIELAHEEGLRLLADQQAQAESARTRMGTVFVIATFGTGFLGPTALKGHVGLPAWAWLAVVALAVSVVASAVALLPRKFRWTMDPKTLTGAGWTGRTKESALTEWSSQISDMAAHNGDRLKVMWWSVWLATVAAALSVLAWIPLLNGAHT